VVLYGLCCKLAEGQYFDSEREILEHFKFKEVFLRRTKKAFISFVPREFIKNISDNKHYSKESAKNHRHVKI